MEKIKINFNRNLYNFICGKFIIKAFYFLIKTKLRFFFNLILYLVIQVILSVIYI